MTEPTSSRHQDFDAFAKKMAAAGYQYGPDALHAAYAGYTLNEHSSAMLRDAAEHNESIARGVRLAQAEQTDIGPNLLDCAKALGDAMKHGSSDQRAFTKGMVLALAQQGKVFKPVGEVMGRAACWTGADPPPLDGRVLYVVADYRTGEMD